MMPISKKRKQMLKKAMQEIKRGSVEIIDEQRLESLVKDYLENGKTYKVKIGMDPTAPDLHLGHTVVLQKMATMQKYGAYVQFLIGDFTGMIGDPTGKNATRKKLDKQTVEKNAKTYQSQVFKILDPKKTEIMFNSTWLNELGTLGLVELTTTFNVARMLEREDFDKRYKSQTPISISEFLYPLLQGYDSVAMDCDIEMGGTDQKFNLLMGRYLQRAYNCKKEQAVFMMPLLEGLDGVNKMSKSLGNYIGVTDTPKDMFGKILSISDELMWRYYELLSSKTLDEIEKLKTDVENGAYHPKKAKEDLALEITARYHDETKAKEAQVEFASVHAKGNVPNDIKTHECENGIWIAKALVDAGLESSTSQARRDIKQGAVKIDGEKLADEQYKFESGEFILQVGKRKFIKLKVN